MNESALCWIDQTIKPAREASVSVFDHGLLYGDGVFEGLRFYRGKTFMLDAHLRRLQSSADAIGLELPLGLGQIRAAIETLFGSATDKKGTNKSALGYVESFFKIINDADQRKKKVVDKCRRIYD